MTNIYDEAWKGTLTEATISSNRSIIDKQGGKRSITLLGAASRNGHLTVVRLLFKYGASPNALSAHGRTPLFYATHDSPVADRLSIIHELLENGADPNITSPEEGNDTPLMNAIRHIRDVDVVHMLIDYGADLKAQNLRGQTAEVLAKGTPLEGELQTRKQRNETRGDIVDALLSAVSHIVAYANRGIQQQVNGAVTTVQGAVKSLYGMSGSLSTEIIQDVGQATTPEEFEKGMEKYIKDSNLDKFFAPGDTYVQDVARKAAALRADTTTDLGKPANIKRLTRLALYQTVIYCDDSGSMEGDRWEAQRELVDRIARVATRIVPDGVGVHLRFINAQSASKHTAQEIGRVIAGLRPDGRTPLGTSLNDKILQPLVYNILQNGGHLEHPLLICTITDGVPDREPVSFKDSIVQCKEKLRGYKYKPDSVKFCISQIGDAQAATGFIDDLRGDTQIEDVIHCTAEQLDDKLADLRQNEKELDVWLLKLLTSPIMKRND